MTDFYIQWHLTNRCQQNCKHCYIDKDCEELNFLDLEKILVDLSDSIQKRHKKDLRIAFSGGDPFLHKDFFKLLERTRDLGIKIDILGNPHLLNNETIKFLKKIQINYFQLSLDGDEETHDFFRGQGSYRKVIKAIRGLRKNNITVGIKFTVSKINKDKIWKVIDVCEKEGVNVFSFDAFIPEGRGEALRKDMLSADDYKELLEKFLDKKEQEDLKVRLEISDSLVALLYRDKEKTKELDRLGYKNEKVCSGCSVGIRSLSILPDGTVLPCRRLPIKIGIFPKDKFDDIFWGKKMGEFRKIEKLEKCRNCDLIKVCRGCPARAYAIYNNYFKIDPLCWKK